MINRIVNDPDLKNALDELEKESKSSSAGGKRGSSKKDNGDEDEDSKALSKRQKTSKTRTSVDPSGYVYETFEDNRVQGVTATLYYENDTGDMQIWDAEEYNQENPLLTDNDGNYAWDVPEGLWQVVYTKEGYETVTSEKMVVPPPQLDVNIAMTSTETAHIEKVSNMGDKLKLIFDKYLLVDTILKNSIQLNYKGENAESAVVVNKKDIRDYNGDQVVKSVELQLQNGFLVKDQEYKVILGEGMETYAGVPLGKDTIPYVADSEAKPVNITIPEGVNVYLEGTEITSEDILYQNDRIKIVANIPEGYKITSLTVNGSEIENESYVTVGSEAVVIAVAYDYASAVVTHTVSFDSDGGTSVKPQTVEKGSKAVKPEDPTKEGFEFAGWYYLDAEYDFNSTVMKNIILTAKWIEKPKPTSYRITASANEGGSIDPNGDVDVLGGSDQTYRITAEQGYVISDVKVDEGSVGAVEEYVFKNVSANHTIEASFKKDDKKEPVKIEKIELSQKEAKLKKGDTLLLQAVITPETAENKQLKWNSDNVEVASVENGLVTAVQAGTAKITAETQDGSNLSASCMITVEQAGGTVSSNEKEDNKNTGTEPVKVQGIELSQKTATLKKGNTLLLQAVVTPENAENKQLKWGSDNEKIASVENGLVTAIQAGIAKITVETQDGSSLSDTCTITVEETTISSNDPGTGKKTQKITATPKKIVLTAGGKGKTLKISGAKGSVTFKSSNPKVAKVTEKGKITPQAAGKATITIIASGDENYAVASLKVNVNVYPKKPGQVKKVKVVPTKAKRTVKVTWKKTAASGYQIQYAYTKKMSGAKTIKAAKGKSVSKTVKKLKSGKYVYIRVRAYSTKGGFTTYGKWSKVSRSRRKVK